MSDEKELTESMPAILELAGIIHDAADGGSSEEYCSWTMANRAAEAVYARLRTVNRVPGPVGRQQPQDAEGQS